MVLSVDWWPPSTPTLPSCLPRNIRILRAGARQSEADAGLELSVKDNSLTVIAPVEGGPAWKAGIKADDHILKINNQPTRNLTALEAARKLQGPPGTKVKLQIVRTGFVKPQDLDLTLEKNTVDSVSYYPLEDGFYYIRLRNPRERSAQELQQILRTIQASPATQGNHPGSAQHGRRPIGRGSKTGFSLCRQ